MGGRKHEETTKEIIEKTRKEMYKETDKDKEIIKGTRKATRKD